MDTTTLLIIIIVVLLVAGGGWYGRGRWYNQIRRGRDYFTVGGAHSCPRGSEHSAYEAMRLFGRAGGVWDLRSPSLR